MKKVTFSITYLITVSIFICSQSPVLLAQNSISRNIIGNELIYNNCDQAISKLTGQKLVKEDTNDDLAPLSTSDKEILTEYLERILLIQPANHQFLTPQAIGVPSGIQNNSMMPNIIDPERDQKAKLCVLKVIPYIYPESANITPSLIEIATDKKNSSELRDNAFELTTKILSVIQKKEFPLEISQKISNKLTKNEELLRSKLSIPFLIALSDKINLQWSEILQTQDPTLRGNILDAILVMSLKESSPLNKIPILLQSIDDGAKAQLLSKLRIFAKKNPRLLEELPNYLSSQSELVRIESLKLLKHMANHPAFYASFYTNHPFPEMSIAKYLTLFKEGGEDLQKEILRALLHIELKSNNSNCTNNSPIETSTSNNNQISTDSLIFLLKKSMCQISPEDKINYLKKIKKQNLDDTILSSIILIRHGQIDEKYLNALIDKLNTNKKKLSSREYGILLQTILIGAKQINSNSVKNTLIDLAIEGLGMNLDNSRFIDFFIDKNEHPSIEFLIRNYKDAETKIEKMLKSGSPLIKNNALNIISKLQNKRTLISKSIILYLSKLLNDNDINTRRSAYLILKELNPNAITTKKGKKNREMFYLSRIFLDSFEDEINIEEKNKQLDIFISSISTIPNELDCREITIEFPNFIKKSINNISIDKKIKIENGQITCLDSSSNTKTKALKNLIYLSPINNENLTKIKNNSNKLFIESVEKSTLNLYLDFISSQTDSKNPNINSAKQLLQETITQILKENTTDHSTYSTLIWLLNHPDNIKDHKETLASLRTNSKQEIAILSSLIYLSLDTSHDSLEKLRSAFNNNINAAKELLPLDISKISIDINNAIKNSSSRSPYFSIFLKSIFCNSGNSTEICQTILPKPSLLLDKPDFMSANLASLIANRNKTASITQDLDRNFINLFISTGHFDELTPLLKNDLMIELLLEQRKNSTNLAYSKILDYLLEY